MPLLSPHLTVAEFIGTSHRDMLDAQDKAWVQTPGLQATASRFAGSVFEPVRRLLGPLHVNSGFRCPLLNLQVGGAAQSRHMLGLAVDVVPVEGDLPHAMRTLASALAAGVLPDIDQAIIECGRWLHIQGAPVGVEPRRMALYSADGKVFSYYA